MRTVTHLPKHHLKWLTTVAHECKDKKGGALLSVLHSLAQHGDPKVHEWILPLLSAVRIYFYFGNYILAKFLASILELLMIHFNGEGNSFINLQTKKI
jgi:Gamma tubulin complex component N-terminal